MKNLLSLTLITILCSFSWSAPEKPYENYTYSSENPYYVKHNGNINWIIPIPTTLGRQITRKSNPELEFVSKIIIPEGAFASISFRTYTTSSLEFEGPMTIELGKEKAFAGIDAIGARQPSGGANQIVLLYVSLPVNQAPVDLTSQKPIDIGQ